MEDAFSSDFILLKILSNLSLSELLSSSLVSKRWKTLSRTVLRDKHRCAVSFSGKDVCQILKEFSDCIGSMDSVPYNDLRINPCHLNGPCIEGSSADVTQICDTILSKMKLKYLDVHWFKELGMPDHNCPVMVTFLKEIFKREHCFNLEFLEFCHLPELQLFTACFEIDPEQGLKSLLPNLTTFKMINCRRSTLEFIKEIIRAAPNIRNLIVNAKSNMLDYFFSSGKCSALKKLVLNPAKNDSKICFRFSKTKPKLKYFAFSSIPDREYGPSQYFFATVKSILESSGNSLGLLYADQLDMVWLGNAGITFPKLSRLSTRFGQEVNQLLGFNSLSGIDFGKLFPNLKSVQIGPEFLRPGVILGDYVNAETHTVGGSFCGTVTELKLKYTWHILKDGSLRMVADVFPNVTHFIFEEMETYFVDCMEGLHASWPKLERISLSGYKVWKHSHAFSTAKCDAAFIGVSDEKIETLSHLDEETLKTLEVQPTRFSFRDFKSLKKFQIDTNHSYRECRINDDNKFIFSPLTGHLVFSKMPDLVVEIGRVLCNPQAGVSSCGYELRELSPFVSFVSRTVEHAQEHLISNSI
ncbi:unnamed protein product [Allacma fusca]|uniref:F-box domain-containing protein n=1 Tax=Allacma fusca TaxID=39272 RepID=A0A8J2PUV9_9HEXA|nr:unnamed protein product [Allacma fusca]